MKFFNLGSVARISEPNKSGTHHYLRPLYNVSAGQAFRAATREDGVYAYGITFLQLLARQEKPVRTKRNMAIHIIDDAKDELKNRSKGRLVCPLKREEEGLKNLGNLDNMMSLLNQGTWDEQRGSTVVTI